MAEEGHKVVLKVYDLSHGLARQLSSSLLGKVIDGIWHTGVVVYGNEYCFGEGILSWPAGAVNRFGNPVREVELGVTHVPKDVFEMYLQEISPRYTVETYKLLSHNCNNFSNEVAQFLVGNSIPDFILQLPNEVLSSPMAGLILPMIQNLEATMKAGGVPQAPQFIGTNAMRPQAAPAPAPSPESRPVTKKVDEKPKSEAVLEKSGGAQTSSASHGAAVADPLGNARIKVQEEIMAEFAAIMATGTIRASEAAALATRRVMQRHGHLSSALPQS